MGAHSSGRGPGRCSCWGDLVLRCASRGRPSVSPPCLQPRVSQSTSNAASLFISSVHNPYLGKSPGGEFIFAASGRCRCRDADLRTLCGENCPHALTPSTCFVVSELLPPWFLRFLTEAPQYPISGGLGEWWGGRAWCACSCNGDRDRGRRCWVRVLPASRVFSKRISHKNRYFVSQPCGAEGYLH